MSQKTSGVYTSSTLLCCSIFRVEYLNFLSEIVIRLIQKKNEEEKETWEMESVDRSAFVQELFLSTFFQPTKVHEMDTGQCFSQQPVDSNTLPTDLSLVTAPSLSMNCMQQPSIEMTQD